MANVSMMLSAANCFAIEAVARHMVGLFARVGLIGITGQVASLSVTIGSAIMTWVIMGWVTTSGMVSVLRHGFTAVGYLGALTTFFKCCVRIGNGTAKAGHAVAGWYVLISVELRLLAPEAAFWPLRQGRV